MSGSLEADAEPVRPSMGMSKWIGPLGIGTFGIGSPVAAVGVSSRDAPLACAGLVLMVLGALSMANAAMARVRAELLQRIEKLERRLSDKGDT